METNTNTNAKRFFDLFMPQTEFLTYLDKQYPEHKAPSKSNLNNLIKRNTIGTLETSYGSFLVDVRAYELEHKLITADFHTPLNLHSQEYLAMLIDYLSKTKTKIDTSEREQNALQNEINTLIEQNTLLNEQNKTFKTEVSGYVDSIYDYKLSIEDLKSQLSIKDKGIEIAKTEIDKAEQKNSEHLSMIDILQTEANGLTDKITNKDEYIDKISTERDEYKKKSEELNIEVKKLEALLEIKNNEMKIFEKNEQKHIRLLKEKTDYFNGTIRDLKQEHTNSMQDLQNRNIMQAIVKLGEDKQVKVKKTVKKTVKKK